MENKKSTVLLTVIAVATLLVAVVGATFAYFTSQNSGSRNVGVSVITSTTANSQFSVTNETLRIEADQTNFTQDTADKDVSLTSIEGGSTATAFFEASNGVVGTYVSKYTVDFVVNSNTFAYKEGATSPELVLVVAKAEDVAEGTTNPTYTDITSATVSAGTVPKHYGSTTDPEGQKDPVKGAKDTTGFVGFDVTTLATGTVLSFGEHTLTSEVTAGAEGAPNTVATQTDMWKFDIVFVNYGWDQNYNAGDTFGGQIRITPVEGYPQKLEG